MNYDLKHKSICKFYKFNFTISNQGFWGFGEVKGYVLAMNSEYLKILAQMEIFLKIQPLETKKSVPVIIPFVDAHNNLKP